MTGEAAGEAALRFKIAGVFEEFIRLSIRLGDMAVHIFAGAGREAARNRQSNKIPAKTISGKGYNKCHLKKTSSVGFELPFL
ncbi:MAG: hypothetical protein NTZ64_10595 [Polaromonas sp.]|nr:hypothetical protein [Polaromonas sp.]